MEGSACPACAEPLWSPRVEKRRAPGEAAAADDCGGHAGGGGEAAALAAAAAVEEAARAGGSGGSAAPTTVGGRQLKMCPSCCAGPLLNENCSDLRRHHGQVYRCCFELLETFNSNRASSLWIYLSTSVFFAFLTMFQSGSA